MQIHELSSPRRTDEGLGDWAKVAGTALKQAVTGPAQNEPSASAGILNPAQKLAAVMKEPAMVKLATQYADEWLKNPKSNAQTPAQVVPAGTAQSQQSSWVGQNTNVPAVQRKSQVQTPQPALKMAPTAPSQQSALPGETPEQKRIRLQKAAQQSIDKTATLVPGTPSQPAAPTPADVRKAKQAQAAQNAQDQMAPFSNLPADQAATQAANIRKARQAQAAKNAQAQMSAVKEDTAVAAPGTYNKKTGAAKLGGKTMTALSDLPANVQQQIQAKQQTAAAATTPTSAKATGTAMSTAPFQVPGAGTNPNPTKPATAAPQPTAAATYLKDFLAFVNEKIAIRDSSTYKMIGLADAEKSKLKPKLDAAKQQVVAAQGNPVATKAAVKDYILTAMAAAQLVASENTVAAAQPQAPAYGQQQPAPVTGSSKAAAATAPTSGQLTGANAVALLNKVGLPAKVLTPAGQAIQSATGNRQLSATGDSIIDTMLEGMGYTVS